MTAPGDTPSAASRSGADREGHVFELELMGGNTERRYRKMRPEVEAMPWGTLGLAGTSPEELAAARLAWTDAAYQEHRTAAGCAILLRALIEARAPIDLIAVASRFPLDELVHVELCARMAMECGGGTEIVFDPSQMVQDPDPAERALMRAAECAVKFFCVGEAVSVPLLRGAWHAARHPLPKAVLGRIVKDEAAHGVFGFSFLDWALPELRERDLVVLGRAADRAIAVFYRQWDQIAKNRKNPRHDGDVLGWLRTDDFLELARKSMQAHVIDRLEARGIPISAQLPPND